MEILYSARGLDSRTLPQRLRRFKQLRSVIFSDAGSGALADSHAFGRSVAVIYEVMSRDGVISCHGSLVGHSCAMTHRVCKSPMATEFRTALVDADQAPRAKTMMSEILPGHYYAQRISPSTQSSLFRALSACYPLKKRRSGDAILLIRNVTFT